MLMIIEIYALFFLIALQALPERANVISARHNEKSMLFIVILLILLAGLRKEGIDNDYLNYKWMYETDIRIAEPSFLLISYIFKYVIGTSYAAVVLLYAFLSLLPKYRAIKCGATYCYLSLLVLISDLFLLQDCTQIRAAVAVGIFLVSMNYLYNRNIGKYLLCCLLALFFHTSSLLMLPLLFLNPKKINKHWWYTLLLLSFSMAFFKLNPIKLLLYLPNGHILEKAVEYTSQGDDYTANVFSIYAMSKLFLLLILLSKASVVQRNNKYGCLLLKIQTLSCCSLFVLSQNMAAALRISEFYSIVDILLFPLIVTVFKEKKIAKAGLVFLCLIWLSMRIFRYGLIKVV